MSELSPLSDLQIQRLRAEIANANGRRRSRILTLKQCLACADRAATSDDGVAWVSGGTVDGWKYPSSQTACVAVRRTDGAIRIVVAELTASKDTSPTTRITGLRRNERPKQFRAWADESPADPAAVTATKNYPQRAACEAARQVVTGQGLDLLNSLEAGADCAFALHDWLLEQGKADEAAQVGKAYGLQGNVVRESRREVSPDSRAPEQAASTGSLFPETCL
jgi:hypothetical protein